MSMKAQKPLGQPTAAKTTINLKDAETIKCDQCGNTLFIQSYMLKKISAIVSPTGKEEMVPIQLFSCGSCGAVPKIFLEAIVGNQSSK